MQKLIKVKIQLILTCLPFFCQFFHVASAMRCHDCTNLEGVESFEAGCSSKTPGVTGQVALKGGYAGCLKVVVVSDAGETGVIRAGYFNKQMEGRALSCYHPEPGFHVSSHVEKITFASMRSCHACDDQDGCNNATKLTLGQSNWILLLFIGPCVHLLAQLMTIVLDPLLPTI